MKCFIYFCVPSSYNIQRYAWTQANKTATITKRHIYHNTNNEIMEKKQGEAIIIRVKYFSCLIGQPSYHHHTIYKTKRKKNNEEMNTTTNNEKKKFLWIPCVMFKVVVCKIVTNIYIVLMYSLLLLSSKSIALPFYCFLIEPLKQIKWKNDHLLKVEHI